MAISIPDENVTELHPLNNDWGVYVHYVDNRDWSQLSYIKLHKLANMEQSILLGEQITDYWVKRTMIFVMKNNIFPTWEDENNINGGCFSFKIDNKNIFNVWNNMYYMLLGETLTKKHSDMIHINGISVSSKKKFCMFKIWTTSCEQFEAEDYDLQKFINHIDGLDYSTCLFIRHLKTKN